MSLKPGPRKRKRRALESRLGQWRDYVQSARRIEAEEGFPAGTAQACINTGLGHWTTRTAFYYKHPLIGTEKVR